MRPVFFYKPFPRLPGSDAGWRWWFNVWVPVAIAVAVICVESTGTFSAQHTSAWLRPFFERVFGPFRDASWDEFHHILRKSGHFIGYGTVSFTFLRAWLHTLDRSGSTPASLADWGRGPGSLLSWRAEATVLAIFSTAIVASCDEFHQTFVPGRTGTPNDVLLDTAGAATLCLLVWLICWTKRAAPLEEL